MRHIAINVAYWIADAFAEVRLYRAANWWLNSGPGERLLRWGFGASHTTTSGGSDVVNYLRIRL